MKNSLLLTGKLLLLFAVGAFITMSASAQSWQFVGNRDFTTGQAAYPVIAVAPSGTPYVLFSDGNVNRKASVMKFDGANWSNVGAPGISSAQAGGLSIITDNSGTPYICYDFTNFDSVAIKKFDGSNWVSVAPAGFTATGTVMARDGAGNIYIAFNDLNAANKVSVMKYNGGTWANVGAPGFSDSTTSNSLSIAFDAANTPYVAYSDNGVDYKATVKKFDGANWVTLGTRGITPGRAINVYVAATGAGKVYLAFGDALNASKATVLQYNGGWAAAGPANFAPVSPAAFGADANGNVYLGYSENTTASITLTHFDGTNWNFVGPENFSAEIATGNFGFTIDNTGAPYVAFADFFDSQLAVVMKYGSATGMADVVAATGISVYPNPANNQFTINTPTGGNYLLLNTLGQRVDILHCKATGVNTFTNNGYLGLYYIVNTDNRAACKIVFAP